MIGAAVAFAAGAWLLQQSPALPPLVAGTLVLPLWLAARHWQGAAPVALRAAARAAHIGACVGAGVVWATIHAHWVLADRLAPRDEGRDIRVAGVVASLPERAATGWRFAFEVQRTLSAEGRAPRRILLTMLDDRDEPSPEVWRAPVAPGERLELTARLRRPHGTLNPHGFDFERWMLERRYRATGYVRPNAPFVRLGDAAGIGALVDRWRAAIRERIGRALPGSPFAGVVVALAIGDQSGMSQVQWARYTTTGVNHLMSISGLHVTMVAGLAAALAGGLWRRVPGGPRRLPVTDAAAWAGLVAATLYALLAGFAIPAQRTLWMLLVVTAARLLRMDVGTSGILAIALGAVVFADPLAVSSPGFWLSFGAVALLLYTGRPPAAGESRWRRWSRAQWAMFLGLAPLLVALFQQVSLVGPLANALAIPLVSLAVVPLSLVAAVAPVSWPAQGAAMLLAALDTALAWLAALPGATYVQHAPVAWTVPLGLAGAAWLLLPRGFPSRWLGGLALLPIVVVRPPGPAEGELSVTMLDVGQGLAVVLRTRSSVLLFDTGPAWGAGADSGSRVIVPYLRGEGIRSIQTLVVSHDDRDHTGGADAVMAAVPVDTVLTSVPAPGTRFAGARRVLGCAAGQSWVWDGVQFAILHPLVPVPPDSRIRDNARSCVLQARTRHGSVLVAADLERDGEARLLAAGTDLRSDVLVVPHHGSRTSSSPAFIEAVSPRAAWFPVGYRNRFGHPHEEVVSRYRSRHVDVLRSDSSGALTAALSASGQPAVRWREAHRRYWHDTFRPP